MGAEDQQRALRDHVRVVDEDDALVPQPLDHVAVVDDLVAHVDGRPEALEGDLDDLDGPVHTGTKAAGIGEDDPHARNLAAA